MRKITALLLIIVLSYSCTNNPRKPVAETTDTTATQADFVSSPDISKAELEKIIKASGLSNLQVATIVRDKAVEVPPAYRADFIGDRTRYLNVGTPLTFRNPAIKLDVLMATLAAHQYGIRIYPAYDAGVVNPMIGLVNLNGSEVGTYYNLAADAIYPTLTPYANDPQLLLNAYKSYVTPAPPNTNDNPSRYYSFDDLKNYLYSHGINAGNASYYTLKIEFGFTSNATSTNISNDYPWEVIDAPTAGDRPNWHRGLTFLLTIADASGSLLVNSLEIGKPCPPKCGLMFPMAATKK